MISDGTWEVSDRPDKSFYDSILLVEDWFLVKRRREPTVSDDSDPHWLRLIKESGCPGEYNLVLDQIGFKQE